MICRANLRKHRRKGAVAVVVAVCLLPLIGVMAFAIDGGLLLAAKRRVQTAADAAAHAAACQLYSKISSDPTGLDLNGSAKAAVFSNAAANGYNNDGSTNKVTVNIPPTNLSKLFQTKPGYAEIIIAYNQPRYFASIFGSGTISISARAVARGTVSQSTTNTLVLLDPSKSGALSVSNAASLTTTGGIQVNSSSVTAGIATNAAQVKAPTINFSGNYSVSNAGSIKATSGSVATAAPTQKDPLSSFTPPNPATLTSQSRTNISNGVAATLSPGVYNGGLSVVNGSNVVLQPGVYYMKGGGFSVDNGSTVTGTGVTIYVDNSAGSTGSGFSIVNGSSVKLTPPSSGSYTGLVYAQDPNSSRSVSIDNGSGTNVTGTIYAPGGSYNVTNGASTSTFGSQFIIKSMNLANGSTIKIDSSVPGTTASTSSLSVVE